MGIKKRLASLMEEKNTNANDLAAKIGVAPTTIYSIMQRDSSRIDIDLIVKISHALGVTADELLRDEIQHSKESVTVTPDEYELIKKFRYLDEYGSKNVLSVLDNEFERCVAQDRKKESNIS